MLAAALEEGINPRTSLWSPPTLDISQNSFPDCRGNYPVGSNYHVSNSTGSGVFSLYTGTQHSVNTFFIKLTKMTGLCDPWRLAKVDGHDVDQHRFTPHSHTQLCVGGRRVEPA
ncbi:MAG: hypothetical protein V9E81_14260 [Marmoricola sp.]